ncbi:MAG: hypothetical protein N3A63_08525 [Bacteroidetes bacterium]|nr:hypothetical protein [Bacteroidota bacterium]
MKRLVLFMIGIGVVYSSVAFAQTTSWRGTVSTAWENAANWTNGVPTATSTVILGDGTVTNQPTISTPTTIAALTYGNAAATTLTVNANLTVTGPITNTITTTARLHNINLNTGVTLSCASANLSPQVAGANMTITFNGGTLNISGDLTVQPTAATTLITFSVGTGTLYVGGTTLAGANASAARGCAITVTTGTITFVGPFTQNGSNSTFTSSGAATITFRSNVTNTLGTFNLTNSTTRFTSVSTITPTTAMTFGNIVLEGGTVTLAGAITVAGNWTNNGGTLNAGTNPVTITGTRTIGGTTPTAFGTLNIGTSTNAAAVTMTNNNSCVNLNIPASAGGGNRSLTHSGTASLTVTGNVTIYQPGTNNRTTSWNIDGGSAIVQGTTTIGGANNTASRVARIRVTSGTLTLNGTTTLSTGTSSASALLTVSTGTININAPFSHGEGTVSITSTGTINFNSTYAFGPQLSAAPIFNTVEGSNITFANNLTASVALTLNATSNTTFTGNSTVTPTANISFGHVTVNSNVTVTTANAAGTLTIAGNLLINGNLGGTGTEPVLLTGVNTTINGSGTLAATSTISGNKTILSTANLTVSGAMTINDGVTVVNNGTVSSTNASGIIGGGANSVWTNAANATLNVAGPLLTTGTLNATANPNTVHYNGTTAAQTIKPTTYHHLSITKGTQTATLGGNITVNGNLTIVSGTLSASTYSITLNGNFSNTGTFSGNTGIVTMAGTNAVISGSGTYNFNTLTITGAGVTVDANTSLTIADNLSTSGSGTFTHTAGGSGTITMTGTTRTISGNNIQLDDLTVSGSVTMNSSITMTGNLTVSGSFTGASGTTLTMAGNGSAISGGGTISLSSLSVINTVTATSNVFISQHLTGGTITASTGTFTFAGNPSQVSGVANLYNVTVNTGATLRLMTNAQLGIGGTFTLSGTLDAVNGGTPNTVTYNGTGAQNVLVATYHHLILANGNTKTAAGALTVNGNITIESGTTFNAGTYTHTVHGNWINNGSFTASSSTIQLTGTADAIIGGTNPSVFNTLVVNKSNPSNKVTVGVNVTAATLNVANGNINTGTNSITITNTRTGNGYIIGTITRSHTFTVGTAYAFESPYNTVTFSTVGSVTSVTVTVTIGVVNDFPFNGSINRQYAISVSGSGYTATLRLHYLDDELNGNVESSMQLWRYNGTQWGVSGKTANNETDNWVEQSSLTDITNRWTISDDQNVVQWNGSTSSSWSTAANWTAIQGSPSLPPSSNDIVQLGTSTFTNQPIISTAVTVKNIVFGSVQPVTVTISTGGSLVTSGITGQWNSNATHSINVGAQTLTVNGDVVLSDGTADHSINLVVGSGSVTILGTLIHRGNASIAFGTGTMTLQGNYVYTGGTFTAGTGTVTYNGTLDQSIAGLQYYNIVISKSSGTANVNAQTTVNGSLTLSTGGTLALNAQLNVLGNVTIGSSTVFQANASTISVGGNWIRTGTFVPGTSTVIVNGSSAQTIDATTFNTLIINKPAGSVTLIGSVIVNSDLTLQSGTLDIADFTLNRSSLGGTFTMNGTTTLRLSGANNFPANFSTYSLAPTSTVVYYGTVAQTVRGGLSYGNLTISKAGATATLGGTATIAGDVSIQTGSTFNGSSYVLTLQGNWVNDGTFTPSTGTVQLAGTNKTVGGSSSNTFNNLTVTGAYSFLTNTTVNGTLTVTGTGILTAGPTTLTIAGNLLNNGTLSSSGILTFTGTQTQNIAMNAGFLSTGIVNFNGTVAPTFTGSSPPTFNNLNVNNTSGISPTMGWTVNGEFTVGLGAKFFGGTATHTFKGPLTNNGIITSSGTLKFEPSIPVTVVLLSSSGITAFSSTGIVEFAGTGALSIVGTSPNIYTLTISNTNPNGITLPAGWTIGNDLNVTSGATFNGGAYTYSIGGSININGTFKGQTSTITMTGSNKTITTGSGAVFNNLTINTGSSISLNSDISMTGNLSVNGTFTPTIHSVIFTGTTLSQIGGTLNPILLPQIVIEKNGATTILAQNVAGVRLLHIKSGVFDLTTYTLTEDSDGGELQINADAKLRVRSAAGAPTFETYDLDEQSIVEYYSPTAQIVTPLDYGSLLFTGTGTKTISTNIVATGNCTIDPGTPLSISGAVTFTVNGNWVDNGLFTAGTSTIVLGGIGKTIVGTTTFNNLQINGTITNTGTITVNGSFTGIGSMSQGPNASLTINGSPVTVASINASANPNTVIYAGSSDQTIIPGSYYDLVLRNVGMKTASSNIMVNNNLVIDVGARFTITTGIVVHVFGRTETYGELNNYGSLLITD